MHHTHFNDLSTWFMNIWCRGILIARCIFQGFFSTRASFIQEEVDLSEFLTNSEREIEVYFVFFTQSILDFESFKGVYSFACAHYLPLSDFCYFCAGFPTTNPTARPSDKPISKIQEQFQAERNILNCPFNIWVLNKKF